MPGSSADWIVPIVLVGATVVTAVLILIATPSPRAWLVAMVSSTAPVDAEPQLSAPDEESVPPVTQPAEPAAVALNTVAQRAANDAKAASEQASRVLQAASGLHAVVTTELEQRVRSIEERVRSIEDTTDQTEEEFTLGRSPTDIIERFRWQDREFEAIFKDVSERLQVACDGRAASAAAARRVDIRLSEAREAVEEATAKVGSASSITPGSESVTEDLQAKQTAAEDVFAEVARLAERATDSARKAETAEREAAEAAERIVMFKARLDDVRTRIGKVESLYAASKAAFHDLKSRIVKDEHRPVEGIDGRVAEAQTRVICEVGDAKVALRLPTEAAARGGCRLQCTPAEKPETWTLEATVLGRPTPVFLGTAVITPERTLKVNLEARDDRNADARAALTTCVLQLDDPRDAGATTFVQLCRPLELGPLVLDRFFAGRPGDARRKYPYHEDGYPCEVAIPATPWDARLDLTGRCGEAIGERVAVRMRAAPESGDVVTLAWSWQGERFLETDLVLDGSGRAQPGTVGVRIAAGRLVEPWDSPNRLGFLWDAAKTIGRPQEFSGLPTPDEMRAQTEEVAPATIESIAMRVAADLRRTSPALPNDTAKNLVAAIRSRRDDKPSLESWIERLRSMLRSDASFQKWQATAIPGVAVPGVPATAKAAPASDRQQVPAYIAHMRERADLPETELRVLLACGLIAELERIRPAKKLAADLVAACGAADVSLTGSVVTSFPSAGGTCVMMSVTDGRPEVRRRPPQAETSGAMAASPAAVTLLTP